jgi:hypothetical protein
MPISSGDDSWMRWAIGAVWATISVTAIGVWNAATRTNTIEATQKSNVDRITKLEDEWIRHETLCAKRKEEIILQVSERLCAAFKDLVKDTKLETSHDLASIKTSLAVMVESNKAIKEDISEIFGRMNSKGGDSQRWHS